MKTPDLIVIGAGAAGLICAITAAKRGRRVLVLEHANKVGKKILMSGGGRCNFTNLYVAPERYLSALLDECQKAGVEIRLDCEIEAVIHSDAA
jgi:hypothetical protein